MVDHVTFGQLSLADQALELARENARRIADLEELRMRLSSLELKVASPPSGVGGQVGASVINEFLKMITVANTRVGQIACYANDAMVGKSIISTGEWCWNEVLLLKKVIDPGSTVIDCGANLGHHSIAFASLVGRAGRVIAIEPSPMNLILLLLNIQSSHFADIIRPVGAAATAQVGEVTLSRIVLGQSENYGGVHISGRTGDICEGLPLDTLSCPAGVSLIKCDVEGAELAVLRGGRSLIEKARPILFVEADDKGAFDSLVGFLDELNYAAYFVHMNAFRTDNFLQCSEDPFQGKGYSRNLFCVPSESRRFEIAGMRQVRGPGDWWTKEDLLQPEAISIRSLG
jgi:FkbM family methyltransferase